MDRAAATTFQAAESRLLGLPISLSPVVTVPGDFEVASHFGEARRDIIILTAAKASKSWLTTLPPKLILADGSFFIENQQCPDEWTVVAPLSHNTVIVWRGNSKVFLNVVEVKQTVSIFSEDKDLF